MKKISNYVSAILAEHKIIKTDDVEICSYGLDVFISSALETISILLIAVILGNFLEALLFFTSFIPLRIYAGGYHANTKLRCYITSLAVYFVFITIITLLPENIYGLVSSSVTAITTISVFAFSPVIHKNKNINLKERSFYRKMSILISGFETAIIIVLLSLLGNNKYMLSFSLGQFSEAIAIILALIKNKFEA